MKRFSSNRKAIAHLNDLAAGEVVEIAGRRARVIEAPLGGLTFQFLDDGDAAGAVRFGDRFTSGRMHNRTRYFSRVRE